MPDIEERHGIYREVGSEHTFCIHDPEAPCVECLRRMIHAVEARAQRIIDELDRRAAVRAALGGPV